MNLLTIRLRLNGKMVNWCRIYFNIDDKDKNKSYCKFYRRRFYNPSNIRISHMFKMTNTQPQYPVKGNLNFIKGKL